MTPRNSGTAKSQRRRRSAFSAKSIVSCRPGSMGVGNLYIGGALGRRADQREHEREPGANRVAVELRGEARGQRARVRVPVMVVVVAGRRGELPRQHHAQLQRPAVDVERVVGARGQRRPPGGVGAAHLQVDARGQQAAERRERGVGGVDLVGDAPQQREVAPVSAPERPGGREAERGVRAAGGHPRLVAAAAPELGPGPISRPVLSRRRPRRSATGGRNGRATARSRSRGPPRCGARAIGQRSPATRCSRARCSGRRRGRGRRPTAAPGDRGAPCESCCRRGRVLERCTR